MIALEILCAFGTIAFAGAGAALLVLPLCGSTAIEIGSLAVLFGGAFVSIALFIFGFALRGFGLIGAVTICCVALGFAGFRRAQRSRFECAWPKPSGLHGYSIAGLFGIAAALVVWQTINQTLRWDGLFAWEIKARLAFLAGGKIPLNYYSDLSRQWSHPHYPLSIPLTECWLYLWIGRADQGLVKLLFPFLTFAGAGFLYTGGLKIGGASWRGAIAAALMCFVPSVMLGPGTATAGWADVPLAVVYLAAVIYLLEYALHGTRRSLWLCGLCAAILPWVKQEGAILWACVFAIVFGLAWKRREILPALAGAAPGGFVIVSWKLFLAFAATPAQGDFVPLSFSALAANLGRIDTIAKFLAAQFVDWDRWSLLWIATATALCQLARRGRSIEAIILNLCIFAPIAAYSGIYIFSAWPNFFAHMSTSLPRLMLDVALVGLLAICLVLPSFSRGKKLEPQP